MLAIIRPNRRARLAETIFSNKDKRCARVNRFQKEVIYLLVFFYEFLFFKSITCKTEDRLPITLVIAATCKVQKAMENRKMTLGKEILHLYAVHAIPR